MGKKSIVIIGILALGLTALIFYRLDQNRQNQQKFDGFGGGSRSAAKVFGKIIVGKTFSDYINLSGSIEPNEQVNLHSEISGIVEEINFKEGSQISQGQVLVRINDAELRAQLVQANTRNDLAAENERRAKLLLEREAISQEEYDIASADFRTAQSQIQLIQAQLAKTTIKAPFSGTIGLRNISQGSFVTPSIVIANLVNRSQVKLLFAIPEKYAHMAEINKEIQFTVQGSERPFNARIYAIEPSIEANTRTLQIRAIADNPSNQLIPGAFANITFPLQTLENGMLVPAEALIPIQNGKKIFVVENGLAKEVIVETGGRTDSEVLVLNGIREGDTILTSGVMSLRNGSPVQVNLR